MFFLCVCIWPKPKSVCIVGYGCGNIHLYLLGSILYRKLFMKVSCVEYLWTLQIRIKVLSCAQVKKAKTMSIAFFKWYKHTLLGIYDTRNKMASHHKFFRVTQSFENWRKISKFIIIKNIVSFLKPTFRIRAHLFLGQGCDEDKCQHCFLDYIFLSSRFLYDMWWRVIHPFAAPVIKPSKLLSPW